MLEIAAAIHEAERLLERHRLALREELREFFQCGPRMSAEEQKKFLVDLWFALHNEDLDG
ncbi:MAG: hypothetical protein LAN64_01820 [Acidobacteriia bacterium]|nr:hypothetical protein [Terriglobia bacterium]